VRSSPSKYLLAMLLGLMLSGMAAGQVEGGCSSYATQTLYCDGSDPGAVLDPSPITSRTSMATDTAIQPPILGNFLEPRSGVAVKQVSVCLEQ